MTWRWGGDDPLGVYGGGWVPYGYWGPATPRSTLPRKVRDLTFAETVLVSQAILGYAPNQNQLVPGQMAAQQSSGPAPVIAAATDSDGIRFSRLRMSGQGAKARAYQFWDPMQFDHIIDPSLTQKAGWGFIISDLLVPTFDSGNAWAFFGIGNFVTAVDETARFGAWWHTDNTLLKWKSGVYTGTAAPTTTLRETTHDDLTFAATGITQAYRLSIFFDAAAKNIKFYADGVLKDTFTPTVAFAQHSFACHPIYYIIGEASADVSLYRFGGGNPRLLTVVPVD